MIKYSRKNWSRRTGSSCGRQCRVGSVDVEDIPSHGADIGKTTAITVEAVTIKVLVVAQVGLSGLVLIHRTRVVPEEAAGRNEAVEVCPDFFEAREELGSTDGGEVWAFCGVLRDGEAKATVNFTDSGGIWSVPPACLFRSLIIYVITLLYLQHYDLLSSDTSFSVPCTHCIYCSAIFAIK